MPSNDELQGSINVIVHDEPPTRCPTLAAEATPLLPEPLPKKQDNYLPAALACGLAAVTQPAFVLATTLQFKECDEVAAASLAFMIQSLFRNTFSGGMSSIANEIQAVRADKKLTELEKIEKIGKIITLSWTLTTVFSSISTIVFLLAHFFLPKLYSKHTADAAFTYLLISSLANFPIIAITMLGQVAYGFRDWSPLLSSAFASRLLAVALSYIFIKTTDWKIAGIAGGTVIASWAVFAGLFAWMRRHDTFKPYFEHSLVDIKKTVQDEFPGFFSITLKQCLQRFTEWGNLFFMTLLLPSDDKLKIATPAFNLIGFVGVFFQGSASAANARLKGKKRALDTATTSKAKEQELSEMKTIALRSCLFGVGVAAMAVTASFFSRSEITDFLIGGGNNTTAVNNVTAISNTTAANNTAESIHIPAENTLLIAAFGLLIDAPRIILASCENHWGKIMLTSMMSLVSMTFIGCPVGYAISKTKSEETGVEWMFIVRDVTMCVPVVLQAMIWRRCIAAERKIIDGLRLLPALREDETVQKPSASESRVSMFVANDDRSPRTPLRTSTASLIAER